MHQLIFEIIKKRDDKYDKFPEGYLYRALFLNAVREISEKRARSLHDTITIKEYSINVFNNHADNIITLTINLFDKGLSHKLFKHLLSENNDLNIRAPNGEFYVSSIKIKKIDIKQIWETSDTITAYELFFPVTTYFNTAWGNYPVLLPLPESIYSNLFHIFKKINLNADSKQFNLNVDSKRFLHWVKTHVYISKHKIGMGYSPVKAGNFLKGFKGNVIFNVKSLSPCFPHRNLHKKFRTVLDFMNKFATLSNVGGNRTAGFGIVVYNPIKY